MHSKVIVVASKFRIQPRKQVFQSEMMVLPTPSFEVLQGVPKVLASRPSFDMRFARSIFAPAKLKA
jgi:hypothetical protein